MRCWCRCTSWAVEWRWFQWSSECTRHHRDCSLQWHSWDRGLSSSSSRLASSIAQVRIVGVHIEWKRWWWWFDWRACRARTWQRGGSRRKRRRGSFRVDLCRTRRTANQFRWLEILSCLLSRHEDEMHMFLFANNCLKDSCRRTWLREEWEYV